MPSRSTFGAGTRSNRRLIQRVASSAMSSWSRPAIPFQRRCVNDREVQLLVGRVEVNEQVEDPSTTQSGRAPTVNFVDNNDWLHRPWAKLFLVTKRVQALGHPLVNDQQNGSQPWTLHVQLHHRSRRVPGINDVDTVVIPFNRGFSRGW